MKPSTRFEVFKRDGFSCVYCGRRTPDVVLEVDHVQPVALGGGDELDNLVTGCFECNRGKAARPLTQVPTALDPKARAERIAEQEAQIGEYGRWRAAQRQRENDELDRLANAFRLIPGATFWTGDGARSDERWYWQDARVREFLRRIGYHDVLDAIDVTSARAGSLQGRTVEERSERIWRYLCGVCWRRIKGPGDDFHGGNITDDLRDPYR